MVVKLMEERKKRQTEQKKYSVDSIEYQRYKMEGDIFKTFGNGLYGITKVPGSFYKPAIAISIAKIGRRIFGELKDVFESKGVQILAGDTDGQMLKCEDPSVVESCIAEFHDRYKHIRVKKEETFDRILFTTKKNYYALRGNEFISKGGIGTSREMSHLTKKLCGVTARMILESRGEWDDIENKLEEIILDADPYMLEMDRFDIGVFKPVPLKSHRVDFLSQTCGKLRILIEMYASIHKKDQKWVDGRMDYIVSVSGHFIQQ
jgi:DNA polymerase elongation subunit (family B)